MARLPMSLLLACSLLLTSSLFGQATSTTTQNLAATTATTASSALPAPLAGALGDATAAASRAKQTAELGAEGLASSFADVKTDLGYGSPLETEKFDYVVVGSGPGGATLARALASSPNDKKPRVLVLEAGPNADAAPVVSNSSKAWVLPVEYVPEYFWQTISQGFHADFSNSSATVPPSATRKRRTRKGSKLRRTLLHSGGGRKEQYTGGRLLGGSSSINGEQVVWPTRKLLLAWQAAVGGDPDWSPENCYARLRALETFTGTSAFPRGSSGPLSVSSEPNPADASAYGNAFVSAAAQAFGGDAPPVVPDYNDPATPTSLFPQWQLSQNATTRLRSSSSTAMLSRATFFGGKASAEAMPNLVVKTQATALRVLFQGNTAVGVLYLQGGSMRTARVTKEVIVAAGQRSSLLLESSGIGNVDIIGPLLAKDGRRVVANLPAVGENLRNDGTVLVPLDATNAVVPPGSLAAGLANPNDLYAGGAFLPYPNATTRAGAASKSTSDRFSQLIGAPGVLDEAYGFSTFTIATIVLNVSSAGSSHILSGDPLAEPSVELPTMGTDADMRNWYWALRQQVLPIVDVMTSPAYGFDASTTETAALLAALAAGPAGVPTVLDWALDHYVPNHHWYGTCVQGTSSERAVVDSGGRVFGVRGLRVADASIVPVKPDGNTQIPAYLVGATIAEKILAGK